MANHMLQAFKEILVGVSNPQAADAPEWDMAVAVLLFEVARADFDVSDDEQALIGQMIAAEYGLDKEAVEALVDTAGSRVDEQTSLHPFLRQINDTFSLDQRRRLVELMWRVALSDDDKHRFEEALIRRVSDLLYVEHGGFIRAKLDAADWLKARK